MEPSDAFADHTDSLGLVQRTETLRIATPDVAADEDSRDSSEACCAVGRALGTKSCAARAGQARRAGRGAPPTQG